MNRYLWTNRKREEQLQLIKNVNIFGKFYISCDINIFWSYVIIEEKNISLSLMLTHIFKIGLISMWCAKRLPEVSNLC